MRLVSITLVAPGRRLEVNCLIDLVWSAARPVDRLEHLCARAGPGRVDLGFFLRIEAPDEALGMAYEIWWRAIAMSPLLKGWELSPNASFRAVDLTGIIPPGIGND